MYRELPRRRRTRRRKQVFVVSVLALLAIAPATARAAFHEILIREVYAGGVADDSYVVLQAYKAGQNFVGGHSVTAYDAAGKEVGSVAFSGSVANGQSQMTILVADTGYASTFPSGPVPDRSDADLNLDPAGGAACWTGLDCVAWGSFSGTLSSPVGSPAASGGIPAGMALRRTIAPGCATLLEVGDDRDDSALDFSAVSPAPRSNASTPSEGVCGAGGAGGGAGPGGADDPAGGPDGKGGASAPQTQLRSRPPGRTRDRTPTFRFGSGEAGASFECKLDRKPFRACRSPFTARRLSFGRHTFQVRARDASGQADGTPAFDAFRVVRRLH